MADAVVKFDPVHAVCVYLRGKPCNQCAPMPTPYGPGIRSCYGLAQDCVNIARHGNPWGADVPAEAIARYQERFNDE